MADEIEATDSQQVATEEIEGGDALEVREESPGEEGAPEKQIAEKRPGETDADLMRRIGQLTTRSKKEKDRADALEIENVSLKRKAEAGPRPLAPDPKEFTDAVTGEINSARYQARVTEYEDELYAYRRANETPAAVAAEVAPEDDENERLIEAHEEFNKKSDEMRKTHGDFDEVVKRDVFSAETRDVIFASPFAPQIAYYLGNNQKEALRIASLPIEQINFEIGKLHARFSVPEKRAVSGAPDPIEPVEGDASVAKDPEKMTDDEWIAWDRAKTIKRRGLGPGG